MIQVKCVVVGDGGAGKTSLLVAFTENRFPEEHTPTVFDNFQTGVCVDEKLINFSMWDTAGQEEYARLRSLSYPETDVFVLCFSTVNRSSFENIKSKWFCEVQHHCPEASLVLVGTKIDLREGKRNSKEIVTKEEGEKLAGSLKSGMKYIECSALTQENLKTVFEEAIRSVISTTNTHVEDDDDDIQMKKAMRSRKQCTIL